MTWLFTFALAGALTAAPPTQSADDKELMQYRLTADVLTKAENIAKAFEANKAKDPRLKSRTALQRELDALDAKENLTPAEQKRAHELSADLEHSENEIDLGINGGSLSEIAAQLQKVPAMAAALKSVGMLPRDFAKFIVTAVQASVVTAMGMPAPAGPAGENVRFVIANQATMNRINKLLGVE